MIGITGINGFVGNHLYKYMKYAFCSAIGLSTNPFPKDNVIKLVDGIPQKKLQMNSIVHCGGLVGNGFSKDELFYANVKCTKNLLNWAEKCKVKHFIFISTGAVYGNQYEWVDETCKLNPTGYYAESKLLAESLLIDSTIPIKTIVRLYFPMGGLQYNHLFSRLAHSIVENHKIHLNNVQGHPYISPIYIDDVCRMIESLITHKICGTYNLSSNYPISIGQIVDFIANFYKINLYKIIENNVVTNYLGRSDKIVRATGYHTFVSPKKALKRILTEED